MAKINEPILQLSLGAEFGPARLVIEYSPLSATSAENYPAENTIHTTTNCREDLLLLLQQVFVGIIANEKLQQSIDEEEMNLGAAVLRDSWPLAINPLVKLLASKYTFSSQELEKAVVATFGPRWKFQHLLEDEDDNEGADLEEPAVIADNVEAETPTMVPEANEVAPTSVTDQSEFPTDGDDEIEIPTSSSKAVTSKPSLFLIKPSANSTSTCHLKDEVNQLEQSKQPSKVRQRTTNKKKSRGNANGSEEY